MISAYTDASEFNYECFDSAVIELACEAPQSKACKDVVYRAELEHEIITAANEHNTNPWVVMYYAWSESRFKKNAIRKNSRELGRTIMQVGCVVYRICKTELGYDMKDRYDQLRCGAYWISRRINECGSLASALAAYNSKGGLCGGTPKGKRIANKRIREIVNLKKECMKDVH